MGTVLELPVVSAPPPSWVPPSPSGKSLSLLVNRKLLPAGPAYLAHVHRTINNLSFAEHDAQLEEERQKHMVDGGAGVEEDDLGVGDEEETEELLNQDPKEWKKQDHYAVLGLSHLRYKATPDQIKVAHRKKVLKHHPDKKASSTSAQPPSPYSAATYLNTNTNDDAFFKCISKAFEVLYISPDRRRQFDSIDPYFEDDAPSVTLFKGKTGEKLEALFFREFGPVFERESRFSKKLPVPLLGSPSDSKATVEAFYDFWYNFDSWRSFEYLDKEVNEGSDNRDDKRYTEKKNKSERARRKKEDTARLRSIVDLTLSLDPRIKRIKQEEKDAREMKKKGSKPVDKKKAEEEERERKKKEEAEAEAAAQTARAEAKKAKAAAATAAKKARRLQRAAAEGS